MSEVIIGSPKPALVEVSIGDDIMADYMDRLFLVVPNEFDDSYQHLVVLCDIAFWNANYDALVEWCDRHDSEVLGMTVNIPNDEMLTIFTLRWL